MVSTPHSRWLRQNISDKKQNLIREKVRKAKDWLKLKTAHEEQHVVHGEITAKLKDGFSVSLLHGRVQAILPTPILPGHPDPEIVIGRKQFKIVKLDLNLDEVIVSYNTTQTIEKKQSDKLLVRVMSIMDQRGITDYRPHDIERALLRTQKELTDTRTIDRLNPHLGQVVRVFDQKFMDHVVDRVIVDLASSGKVSFSNIQGNEGTNITNSKNAITASTLTPITKYGIELLKKEISEQLIQESFPRIRSSLIKLFINQANGDPELALTLARDSH